MEQVVGDENLARALKAVKGNQGAPGIDHMKTTELESHLQTHWPKMRAKLLAGDLGPEPGKAGRDTEAERGNTEAGNPDGCGSRDSADAVASADGDLRSDVQRAQLWISAGTQRTGRHASRAAVRAGRKGLGGGH